ncbi:apolipoprotein acyltransferase [Cognatishimia activa]|uniref:apolipoprotein acyltransferase n=1 Tax=Cognatishimia activa TaxID=1715691 RepID=UPI00222FF14A|nr:apolipoprotein acyltransferase [Cognatishimia activa]UZD92235.1 apolipoprotein acyltransferase [Cognatishimia activa]
MYLITGLIGILIGAITAKRRNGKTADILHYAAGYGIAFAVAGFILTLIIEKNFL